MDSPDVAKDFPGLYSSEKRKGNDSDYNEESEKSSKKEMIIGKKKDKKERKEKDKGYAALEGESSDDASSCKSKKSKPFKFTSKSKDKEKEAVRDKGECSKSRPKKKVKTQKFPMGFGNKPPTLNPNQDIAEGLPIFGVNLQAACQRARCHDGVRIPLPVRECIDYIEAHGINFENVYKVTGNKAKVNQIKKMYNNREIVRFEEFDVPTVTSVLKAFLRELPEPIFTNDLLVRFEEAGAILNCITRSKHLKALLFSLSDDNYSIIAWLIMHLHNITEKEHVNKMSVQIMSHTLNHCLHISPRLLGTLINHRFDFYSGLQIITYTPPLVASSVYPDDEDSIVKELQKLDSAIELIHWEMQQGFSSKIREDQLWENQRVQTALKRKLKTNQKSQEALQKAPAQVEGEVPEVLDDDIEEEEQPKVIYYQIEDESSNETDQQRAETYVAQVCSCSGECASNYAQPAQVVNVNSQDAAEAEKFTYVHQTSPYPGPSGMEYTHSVPNVDPEASESSTAEAAPNNDPRGEFARGDAIFALEQLHFIERFMFTQAKNEVLRILTRELSMGVDEEKKFIEQYKRKMDTMIPMFGRYRMTSLPRNFEEVRQLLIRENHMLEIKKFQLIREMVECREHLADMEARWIMAHRFFQ